MGVQIVGKSGAVHPTTHNCTVYPRGDGAGQGWHFAPVLHARLVLGLGMATESSASQRVVAQVHAAVSHGQQQEVPSRLGCHMEHGEADDQGCLLYVSTAGLTVGPQCTC